jgi:hypothetical protein
MMNKNKMSFVMLGIIFITLFFVNVGSTDDSHRWILYGKSDMGDSYYDQSSITEVSPKVIQLWNKDKYSEVGKEIIIQGRKSINLSIEGYDKLDYVADIIELDCVSRTIKDIFFVEYDDEDEVLFEYDIPSPKIKQVSPGSIQETLLKMVCP